MFDYYQQRRHSFGLIYHLHLVVVVLRKVNTVLMFLTDLSSILHSLVIIFQNVSSRVVDGFEQA